MLRSSAGMPDAEGIAIAALGFIAADPERLGRFLGITGIGPETLRAAATEQGFLGRILDYLGDDETLLLAFAANEGLRPETVAGARIRLSGSTGLTP